MNSNTWELIRETHDISTPRELKSHVNYGEIQHLEVKNWRLREAHAERVTEADLSIGVQRLKELYEQALEDICKEDE